MKARELAEKEGISLDAAYKRLQRAKQNDPEGAAQGFVSSLATMPLEQQEATLRRARAGVDDDVVGGVTEERDRIYWAAVDRGLQKADPRTVKIYKDIRDEEDARKIVDGLVVQIVPWEWETYSEEMRERAERSATTLLTAT